MPSFLVYDSATGQPLFVQQSRNPPTLPEGHAFIAAADGTAIARGDVVTDGALTRRPATLDELRAAKRAAAETRFRSVIAGGFGWAGALYQIDSGSQARIAAMGGLALASLTAPDAPAWDPEFCWIAGDNSRVHMDARTACGFAQAVARHVGACILNLRGIKDAVADATDAAALDTIDVTAGYPGSGAP
ncbi:MAG TPA: hypothetical protein VL899_13210 [Alphaproteobacteria bacterium]|jgi:hypothetical protein|nr:hypothetical protein [Alphaproteobacteria bacterium]